MKKTYTPEQISELANLLDYAYGKLRQELIAEWLEQNPSSWELRDEAAALFEKAHAALFEKAHAAITKATQ